MWMLAELTRTVSKGVAFQDSYRVCRIVTRSHECPLSPVPVDARSWSMDDNNGTTLFARREDDRACLAGS